MDTTSIIYETGDGRARITLNRPEKHNALSLKMQAEICDALWEADNDSSVHCVILKGAGPSFSAGYDLAGAPPGGRSKDRSSSASRSYRKAATIDDDSWQLERAQRFRMALFDMHKPSIAQVHGYCLAGGTDLALLADMVIAADDAVIGFPPARNHGALPNNMWLYNVGPQWAKRLTLTGDTVTGKEAAAIGLVMKAVPARALEDEAEGLADRLALIDPDLLSANKRIINLALELMGARTLQRLAAENDARAHTAAAARAFVKKIPEIGLKAALRERDAKFPKTHARVAVPEGRLRKTRRHT